MKLLCALPIVCFNCHKMIFFILCIARSPVRATGKIAIARQMLCLKLTDSERATALTAGAPICLVVYFYDYHAGIVNGRKLRYVAWPF